MVPSLLVRSSVTRIQDREPRQHQPPLIRVTDARSLAEISRNSKLRGIDSTSGSL
jgi:hypothetical protein